MGCMNTKDKTKLDQTNPQHMQLIALMAAFVDDWGYTTRELFELLDHSKNQLWHALVEIEKEKREGQK
jgi:hypothetical protein